MDTPLVIDEKDQKWVLLGKILGIVGSRRVKQEMAKQGVGPVNMAGVMLKIVLIAMFFAVDISYVVEELNRRIELRRFAKVGEIPGAKEIYRFLSRFSEEQFVGFVSGVFSSICSKMGRNGAIVVDSTDVSLDLNWFRKRITKADLDEREFKWGYDTIIFDKGYYGYKNYVLGISRFKIIPLIFSKINFKMGKLMGMLSYPLSIFNRSNPEKEKEFFQSISEELKGKA